MRTPLFRGTKRWIFLVASLLLFSVLLTACGGNSPSILEPAGIVARNESDVFWAILIIATIVFVGVEGMLIYSIIRFRERPGMPHPRQIHGNNTLELAWTIIPAVILFIVLFYTIRGLFLVAPSAQPASANTVHVRAVGHQWWWEFYYQDYKVTTADTMHVPADTVIQVDLYSNNVIHSFWVPQLTGKTDVVPGHDNQRWFKADADAAGKEFLGICAEYCGTQHGNMRFSVQVDSPDQFQTWVTSQQQAAAKPTDPLAIQGQKVFAGVCTGCHGIVGVNLKGFDDPKIACDRPDQACLVGPNLTHFGSRKSIAGGVLRWDPATCQPNDPNLLKNCNLAKWLHDPQSIKPGNDMVVSLTDDQVRQLVAYLEGLR